MTNLQTVDIQRINLAHITISDRRHILSDDLDYTRLELKYGPAFAQQIQDQLKSVTPRKSVEFMDVKAVSELLDRFRPQATLALWQLKDWRKKSQKKYMPPNLVELQDRFLERNFHDAFQIYRVTQKLYYTMYRQAIAEARRARFVGTSIGGR